MKEQTNITDLDIHAYVDNQIDPKRRSEVEAYLKTHPDAAALVEDYRLLSQSIQDLYDPVLDDIPNKLILSPRTKQAPKPRWLIQAAAVFAWVALGSVIGWNAHSPYLPLTQLTNRQLVDGQERDLVRPASFAHAIYTTETKHPVEVGADQSQHLQDWLSKRMHTNIKAPDLNSSGFRLIGGRLLPSTDRMAAQFMYQRDDGNRITLYIRRGAWDSDQTTFHYSNQGGISVLYWIEGEMGYALSGEIMRTELFELSEEVRKQIGHL